MKPNDNSSNNGLPRQQRKEEEAGMCFYHPSDVGAQDMAQLVAEAQQDSTSAFRKLRRRFQGDGSLEYKVNNSGQVIILSQQVWNCLEELCTQAQDENDDSSNFERPFVVAVQQPREEEEDQHQSQNTNPKALQAFVFAMGNENCCFHHPYDLIQARNQAPKGTTHMAFGHTHPCFDPPRDPQGFGMMSKRAKSRLQSGVTFGAMPSNVFVGYEAWAAPPGTDQKKEKDLQFSSPHSDKNDATTFAIQQEAAVKRLVLDTKLYKRHGGDFSSAILHQKQSFNPPGFGPTSHFEFIFTPKLRQLGVFHLSDGGICEYTPCKT